MDAWVKEGEEEKKSGEQAAGQKQIFRAAGAKTGRGGEDKVSPILTVQLLFCLCVVAFVLVMRFASPDFFAQMGKRYGEMLTQGVSLTSSGELFRFASAGVESLQEKLRRAVEQLGAEKPDSALGQGGQYEVTHAEYLKTVTLAGYVLSDKPAMPVQGTLTSPFGYRVHPITGKTDFHTGVDLAAPLGTPAAAVWPGVVAETGFDDINGNYVKVIHSGSVCTTYNHLSQISVKTGQSLKRGETVGLVGSTGVSTGPHLHFELLIDGVRVDPAAALGL
ncbi:M23 family metallopeptidase [Anaerofilum sp. BX8]|uniref:M23 family metallopeptidase n=1 Tax=Anaerofilum hominis TaxID=2763016 RepID=A0A923KX38_9FIRM|nr:M23 family metallopeptidase [Anaerofilum hominis]MBC5579999.1 M23 family metallopeptidase [Anaerofilum hominis]